MDWVKRGRTPWSGGAADGVAGVDEDFSFEVIRAGEAEGIGGDMAGDGEHQQIGEGGGFAEGAEGGGGMGLLPLGEFGRLAGTDDGLVAMFEEASGESFSHIAGTEDTDFHFFPPLKGRW